MALKFLPEDLLKKDPNALERKPLKNRLGEGPLKNDDLLELATQIADALDAHIPNPSSIATSSLRISS